jgi:quercetin dioxygenase-like cupin family protein
VLELNKSFVVPAGQKHELQITEDFQAVVIMEKESEIKFINN